MLATGTVAATVVQGAFNMLPVKAQNPWARIGIATVTMGLAFFIKGDGLGADAVRGSLIGTSITQGRSALVNLIAPKVTTGNKFVQGMLNAPANYEEIDYEDIDPNIEEVEYVEVGDPVEVSILNHMS